MTAKQGISLLQSVLSQNDDILSRTATGSNDISASSKKKQLMVRGNILEKAVKTNRNCVTNFIWSRRKASPIYEYDYYYSLITIAHIANFGLLEGTLIRQWPYEDRSGENSISSSNVHEQMRLLACTYCSVLRSAKPSDVIKHLGEIEWELGSGPLHPFYDGCGRISRYFVALLAAWHDAPLVYHLSRDDYYIHASKGRVEFGIYYSKLFTAEPF